MRDDAEASRATREALDVLLFCENLSAQSHEYLTERPSLERIAETVQRIEETMADQMEEPIGAAGRDACRRPGRGRARLRRDKRAARGGGDPLMEALAGGMKGLTQADAGTRAAGRMELSSARRELLLRLRPPGPRRRGQSGHQPGVS